MHLSQTAQYALRALLIIDSRAPDTVRAGELTESVGAPSNYLSKTLHLLVRAGILSSCRGPTGGFKLAVPPESITLQRVASLFAAPDNGLCLFGGGKCGEDPSCVVHQRWRIVAQPMDAFFNTTTIADLRADARPSSEASHRPLVSPSTRGSSQ